MRDSPYECVICVIILYLRASVLHRSAERRWEITEVLISRVRSKSIWQGSANGYGRSEDDGWNGGKWTNFRGSLPARNFLNEGSEEAGRKGGKRLSSEILSTRNLILKYLLYTMSGKNRKIWRGEGRGKRDQRHIVSLGGTKFTKISAARDRTIIIIFSFIYW